jgi:hypothetical protein
LGSVLLAAKVTSISHSAAGARLPTQAPAPSGVANPASPLSVTPDTFSVASPVFLSLTCLVLAGAPISTKPKSTDSGVTSAFGNSPPRVLYTSLKRP